MCFNFITPNKFITFFTAASTVVGVVGAEAIAVSSMLATDKYPSTEDKFSAAAGAFALGVFFGLINGLISSAFLMKAWDCVLSPCLTKTGLDDTCFYHKPYSTV